MKPITRERLKARIDELPPERLQLADEFLSGLAVTEPEAWSVFIEETYGAMTDAPIERGDVSDFARCRSRIKGKLSRL